MEFNPITLDMLRFNEEYRSLLDGNFKQAAAVINELNRQNELLKKRLEAALLNPAGGGNPEVVAARVARDGTTHGTLHDHTDAIEQSIEANTAQIQLLLAYQDKLKQIFSVETVADIVYYVSAETGDDGNPGTSEAPFKTIQRAVDSIPVIQKSGSITINVEDGIYNEDISINDRLGVQIYLVGNTDVPPNVKINTFYASDISGYLNVSGLYAMTTIGTQFTFERCSYANINKCHAVENNKAPVIYGIHYVSSRGVVSGCTVSNSEVGVLANFNSQITLESDNVGVNNTFGYRAGRSVIHDRGATGLQSSSTEPLYYAAGLIVKGGIIG